MQRRKREATIKARQARRVKAKPFYGYEYIRPAPTASVALHGHASTVSSTGTAHPGGAILGSRAGEAVEVGAVGIMRIGSRSPCSLIGPACDSTACRQRDA
ncbi:hypothetical protein [Streptomyces sp. SR-10]|uniref:hypothetical protein n=1 Tax=Streptomyces sp. SR-10 TaxID=3416442 RepID=UPI003CF74550